MGNGDLKFGRDRREWLFFWVYPKILRRTPDVSEVREKLRRQALVASPSPQPSHKGDTGKKLQSQPYSMPNEQSRDSGLIASEAPDETVFSLLEAARRRVRKPGPSGTLGGIGAQIAPAGSLLRHLWISSWTGAAPRFDEMSTRLELSNEVDTRAETHRPRCSRGGWNAGFRRRCDSRLHRLALADRYLRSPSSKCSSPLLFLAPKGRSSRVVGRRLASDRKPHRTLNGAKGTSYLQPSEYSSAVAQRSDTFNGRAAAR